MKESQLSTTQVESSAKRWVIILGLSLLALTVCILLYKLLSRSAGSSSAAKAGSCVASGGVFDPKHSECVGINKSKCDSMGGEYIKCGSPCRHTPSSQICAQVCDEYCQL